MHRRALLALAASSLALTGLGIPAHADEVRITGPIVHENLAIYPIHGKSSAGPVPLTLDEALAKRAVKVHETGTVSELQIENLGGDEVFVQSGDIVKGGQQDRVLSVSLMLPPKSGRIPIAAFCVERGRWTARGKEDARTFATASAVVPSREAKLAIRAVPAEGAPVRTNPLAGGNPSGIRTGYAAEPSPQQQVWDRVQKLQDNLKESLGASVAAPASQSSLQLSLENEKLKDAQDAYLKVLTQEGEKDGDIVGFAFAVNGKLNSAEIYPSNGLFRKMWPKLLQAAVTEAIGGKNADSDAPPTSDAALAFVTDAMNGQSSERPLPAKLSVETRQADNAIYVESRRANGAWVHRSYVAK